MILVEGFLWIPIVFLLMSTPFRSMDPSLEEAATTAGSTGWQVFQRVTFPLALPSVLAVLILTFIRSLEAFEIPALIGIPAGVEVLTTKIYLQIKGGLIPKYGEASAYSIILIVIVALGLIPYYRITSKTYKFTTISGKNYRAPSRRTRQMALARRAAHAGAAVAPALPHRRHRLVVFPPLRPGAVVEGPRASDL